MKKQSLVWLTLLVTIIAGINFAQAGPGTLATPVKLSAPFNTGPGGNTYTYYANSPAGKYFTAFGNISSNSGRPLRKFVDSLPGLGSAGANNLGAYIPIAKPLTNPVAGDPAEYYEIEVKDFNQQMHSDLPGPLNGGGPGTKLRGYRDMSNSNSAFYLGPLIIAKTYDPTKPAGVNGNGRPTRIKLVNSLGHSNGLNGPGDLFIPVDTTAMGAGQGPDSWLVDTTGLVTKVVGQVYPSGITDNYLQNRAELHLHGGVSPWISDGTPHQWITPAVDSGTRYPKGVTQVNVPDMPDPGPGAATYYYSNQQSARLMWYHDHAYGLTRLNAYVGEAAGYLLTDQAETDMIAAGVLPDVGTPLILQDKTFVPQDIAVQDAKWDRTKFPTWGTYGDLWFPHVYEPNQNPLSRDGSNPYGRWDYGPWFWPPVQLAGKYVDLPSAGSNNEPTLTPEGFMDTALVNGTAYPFMNVEPKAYRFRILNGSNDRPLNLQLYVSDLTSPGNVTRTDANGGTWGTEVAMVPAAKWANCTSSTPATPTAPLMCSCTATFSPIGCRPAKWPSDGREGGVPDPQFIGPTMVQIGTEGGILPAPVVINNQPVSYDYNRRNIVVLDILDKSLLLAPAERADVLVDFTAFAGKTIILYNDAPAPMPAFDSRYDYFTGGPDQTPNGGAPSTLAGYGPNTRTFMQFRVAATATAPALHYKTDTNADTALMATLTTAVKAAFALTQPTPIVPQPVYAANYPASTSPNLLPGNDVFSSIFDTALTFTPIGAAAASSPVTVNFQSKAIQELWDPYGRMNATLGIELPMTNNRVQTTIPYGYVDPPTELLADNGSPLLWKITHNGVDTHPVHFHLYNVQLINRVGWDGAIRPPDANELGWKETVRMKPLEDVVVAFQPVLPKLPFGIPRSQRLLDPAFPAGAISTVNAAGAFSGDGPGFMNIDPLGLPVTVVNAMQFFDHEYVWHCHILGHEENDFMRPQIVADSSVVPDAPALAITFTPAVTLTWSDGTPVGVAATMGNTKNEIGYRIYRCAGDSCTINVVTDLPLTTALANQTTYSDGTASNGSPYTYQVVAYNAAGTTASNFVATQLPSAATPGSITVPASSTTGAYNVSWTASSTLNATYVLQEATNAAFTQNLVETIGATSPTSYSGKANGTYYYRVKAQAFGFLDSGWVSGQILVNRPIYGGSLNPSVPTPQLKGASITFTASAQGGSGTPYEYEFWQYNGVWTLVKPYSTSNTWVWDTNSTAAGNYQVNVHVRNQGQTAFFNVLPVTSYTISPNPLSGTLSAGVPSPQLKGASITFTASAQGGSGTPYEYEFWRYNGGAWVSVQSYSTSNTWVWDTNATAAGNYQVNVHIRNQGQTAFFNVLPVTSYTISPNPLSGTLSAGVPSPQLKGASITFTASAQGGSGTPYEYEFWRYNGVWTLVKPYSTSNTWVWDTNATAAGNYQINVHIRNQGLTAFFNVLPVINYTVSP
jgi:FtsP/CotA-like multicopper oxidase with cupredoxin domain